MDGLGVHFIEGGWPGANPKDIEFFRIIKTIPSTGHRHCLRVDDGNRVKVVSKDPNMPALLEAETKIIRSCAEKPGRFMSLMRLVFRLRRISNSSADLSAHLQLERPTGILRSQSVSLTDTGPIRITRWSTIRHAVEAGAERMILCDTNGG